MTKMDLIEAVAQKTDMSKRAAGMALEAILESISAALIKGDKATITGFGTFLVSNRAARAGVNPRTGEKIQIAASKAVRFKAGKGFRDGVRK